MDNPVCWTRIRDRIRRKHYSIRTEQAYVDWVRRFVLRHNKSRRLDRAWQISAGMAVTSLGFDFASSRARPALIVDAMQDRLG